MAKQKPTLNRADISLLKQIFATKKDLKKFVTKKDFDKFETKKDAAKRHAITIKTIFKYLDKNFATKKELNELKDKIANLPTKQEFFREMDKLAGEYKSFREEKEIILQQYERIRQQLNLS